MSLSNSYRYINYILHNIDIPHRYFIWKLIITSDSDLFIIGTPYNGSRNDCNGYGSCNSSIGYRFSRLICREGICNGGRFISASSEIRLSLFLVSVIRANKTKFKYVEI